jgi:hypothetical protein
VILSAAKSLGIWGSQQFTGNSKGRPNSLRRLCKHVIPSEAKNLAI